MSTAKHCLTCAACGATFDAVHGYALTCSNRCRLRRHRARTAAAHARLADEADRAIAAGDLDALQRTARHMAALLR